MKNISELVTFVIGLSVFIERVNEVLLDAVIASVPGLAQGTPERAAQVKSRLAIFSSMILGVVSSLAVASTMPLPEGTATSTYIILGVIAGAMAPYSHNVLQLFYKVQKLAEAQTQNITPKSDVAAAGQ